MTTILAVIAAAEKPYTVSLWGSHPDAENDDCWTGDDFATREEAEAVFRNPFPHFEENLPGYYASDTAFVEIDGPDLHETRRNPLYRAKRRSDDSEWRRERAMEAGMLHGVEAYNDEMGY